MSLARRLRARDAGKECPQNEDQREGRSGAVPEPTSRSCAGGPASTWRRARSRRVYKADRETVVKLLNEALATEIVSRAPIQVPLLHGERHRLPGGQDRVPRACHNEEQQHADMISERITRSSTEGPITTPKDCPAAAIPSTRRERRPRHDPRGSRRRARRDRFLFGDDPVPRRRRSHDPAHARNRSSRPRSTHADDMKTLLETIGKKQGRRRRLTPRCSGARRDKLGG